jgi:hypothetical protein
VIRGATGSDSLTPDFEKTALISRARPETISARVERAEVSTSGPCHPASPSLRTHATHLHSFLFRRGRDRIVGGDSTLSSTRKQKASTRRGSVIAQAGGVVGATSRYRPTGAMGSAHDHQSLRSARPRLPGSCARSKWLSAERHRVRSLARSGLSALYSRGCLANKSDDCNAFAPTKRNTKAQGRSLG